MKPLSHKLIIELKEILKEELKLDLDFDTVSKLGIFLVEYFQILLINNENEQT